MRMLKGLQILIAVCLAALSAGTGYAIGKCDDVVLDVQQSSSEPYDVSSDTPLAIYFLITVDILDPPGSCDRLDNLHITAPGTSGNFEFSLQGNSDELDVARASGAPFNKKRGNRLQLHRDEREQLFDNGSIEVVMLDIAPGQAVSTGTYLETATAEMGDAITDFEVSATIGSAIEILEGADLQVNVVDFGIVDGPVARSAAFMLRSNVAYMMQIQSENNGTLVHTSRTGAGASMAYEVSVDGALIDLSPVGGVMILRDSTGGSVRAEEIDFLLMPAALQWAGEYGDTVTYTITAY
ncbi:MAG: hypothetical protein P8P99_01265 [Maricaulis sp.]|nr:hypothetical protein [Maricaulis sp.]